MKSYDEHSKGGLYVEDEYEKYDQLFDGSDDERLINSGVTIIRSQITLTDSQEDNRTIVRRTNNEYH